MASEYTLAAPTLDVIGSGLWNAQRGPLKEIGPLLLPGETKMGWILNLCQTPHGDWVC